MFEKGDYIVYGARGICQVMDITTADMDGVPEDKLYYVLYPCYEKESKIMTPVKENKTIMRGILSSDEAHQLIENIPSIEVIWIDDHKKREVLYKEALKTGKCQDLISVIKTLYLQKQDRLAQGKKTLTLDERYLKIAEESLYSELAISLGIPREDMVDYISERIQQPTVIA